MTCTCHSPHTVPSSSPQTALPFHCHRRLPLASGTDHIFAPLHCEPLHPKALRFKGDRVSTCFHAHQKACSCATLVLRTIAPAAINKIGSTGLGSGGAISIRDTKTSLLSSVPRAKSSKAAFHHHQNAPKRRNQQGVVFQSQPGQPLAFVCMPRQWEVLQLGGCVSGIHMWCGRCLVMPGVKRCPIRWNQTGNHVLKGTDTTRISGLGTPRIGLCCCHCFSVALAALDPRVIAANGLDSTPKALLTCRLPAPSVDSTTDSSRVRPKRGRDCVCGGVGHGVRRQPTEPNNTAGPRFRSQWQAASFMHHRRADHP